MSQAAELAHALVEYDAELAERVLGLLRAEQHDEGASTTTGEWKGGFGRRERVRALEAELRAQLGAR
jgi:hypothetical protein